MPMPMSVAINPPVAASGPVQPPQTSTSWAAAAGKGLPTTTHNEVNFIVIVNKLVCC